MDMGTQGPWDLTRRMTHATRQRQLNYVHVALAPFYLSSFLKRGITFQKSLFIFLRLKSDNLHLRKLHLD